jgi:hypothetical protein
MLYRLDRKINDECLDGLINVINELQPFETLDLYLRGEGGELGVADSIVDILNNITFTNTLNIYAYEFIMSAHFHIFFNCKAHSKKLSPNTYGMIHKGRWNIDILEGGHYSNDDYNVFLKAYTANTNSLINLKKFIKFNSIESKFIKENKDLYILPERMGELLDYNRTKTQAKQLKITLDNEHIKGEFNIS